MEMLPSSPSSRHSVANRNLVKYGVQQVSNALRQGTNGGGGGYKARGIKTAWRKYGQKLLRR